MEKESKKSADSKRNDMDDHNNQEAPAEVLERGDIFFFYRPKTKIADDSGRGDVKGIEDIRRFFMVTATTNTTATNSGNEQQQLDRTNRKTQEEKESRYRLFVIGKKSLPEIRTTEARRSRSEEHTSELQSRQYLVCRLLLEKKKLHLPISTLLL